MGSPLLLIPVGSSMLSPARGKEQRPNLLTRYGRGVGRMDGLLAVMGGQGLRWNVLSFLVSDRRHPEMLGPRAGSLGREGSGNH